MNFTPIDYDTWERRKFLESFKQTTIYATVQSDIAALYKSIKRRSLRLYPALAAAPKKTEFFVFSINANRYSLLVVSSFKTQIRGWGR